MRTLERRIVAVFVGLLLLIVALILLLVDRSSAHLVAAESQRQLTSGAVVFERIVEHGRKQLETAAIVLSGDFSFREAIATQDRPTMVSMLGNHSSRIGASVMIVASLEGRVIADTQHPNSAERTFPFAQLLAQAQMQGRSSGFALMADGHLYQLVIVPIQAPTRIAWVAMGFQVDQAWVSEVAGMSALDISVIASRAKPPVILASSLPGALRADSALLAVQPGMQARELEMGSHHYQALALPLGDTAHAVLQHSVDQSQGAFNELMRTLALISLGGSCLFVLGSIGLARRIVNPIDQLAQATALIAAGTYDLPVVIHGKDEIGRLANSFELMREGIFSRERKILRLAYEDALTQLPNRTRFLEWLGEMPAQSPATVAVLDLDRFAMINSALGHPVGDRLLCLVGERLRANCGEGVMLARLWGDEFAFLVQGASKDKATAFAQGVLLALHEPLQLDGQRIDVSGSIGLAFRPVDGIDADTLLLQAEQAMFDAKRRQCGFALATGLGDSAPAEHLTLIGEMRNALTQAEFTVYYQPKLLLGEGRIYGAEALIRWQHPVRGMISPGVFIPFAEQTGFIREITPWLLRQVIAQAAIWHGSGLALVISANLSARDLLNPQFVILVSQLLEEHQLPAQMLCLEITESALMEDPAMAQRHLADLAALGVRLSIDDYGAGQASLAYLKNLPVHELKIDQSFVRSLTESPKDGAIVRSTVALGHALGLTVVAEGVETAADQSWLQAADCDIAQGYFIARPMPAEAFAAWVSSWSGNR